MKIQRIHVGMFLFTALLLLNANVFAQDPNFQIYLCFGQSNMEGQGGIEAQDRTVDSRFQVMEAVNCSNLGRTMGSWYAATPPLCRCYTHLSPADYFGRTMVENLPDSIRIGVINVSVSACKIELFDKDNYQDYVATLPPWMIDIINEYGGNPYARLVDMAKLAQQDGVIKGILLHQGESNLGDDQWPSKVKGVYDNLINDLALNPDSVPLLAGEVVQADQGSSYASMNSIIAMLPQTIPNSYVISSSGCTADQSDNVHFDSAGYRELGRRYAVQMLSLLDNEVDEPEGPEGTESTYFEPECATIGENWDILAGAQASNGFYVMAKPGIQSLTEAPGSEGTIDIPFSVDTTGNFNIFARLNCPSYDDDSFWVKIDSGAFVMCDELVTDGWQWLKLNNYELTAGEHTLAVTYCEDGAKLDKICISNYTDVPEGIGEDAENLCDVTGIKNSIEGPDGYSLRQNYPNPFNPSTEISYNLSEQSFVTLKIYDVLGREILTLVNEKKPAGTYKIIFNAAGLVSGVYYYQLKTENFMKIKKMILIK